MEEVRQLVQEEGREARNLVAFHVAVDTPSRISRKPPRAGPPPRRATPRPATRLRSASAGRDKRSELRARYWALLFGDLQRAIGEIYNTVEAHENLSECQEVILVLENYTRDFKALAEWFRLKWEYDNTPPPQRPQSLAWEIRKTDFVRPDSRRAYSVKSSPSVSGKNSPCLSGHNTPSGKNSPNLTGKASPGSGKISPRITGHSNTNSPKANIEFFSSKIASKITAKPEPKSVLELLRLSDIKEKEGNNIREEVDVSLNNKINHDPVEEKEQPTNDPVVELGKTKEYQNTCPKLVVIKSPKRTVLAKEGTKTSSTSGDDISSQAKATIAKLDAMENEFLAKHLTENFAKNDNQLNLDKENESVLMTASVTNKEANLPEKTSTDDKASTTTESPVKSEDNFADVSNESSCKTPDSDEKLLSQEEKVNEENKIDTEVDSSVLKEINMDQDSKVIESSDEMKVSLNNPSVEIIQDSNDREQIKDNAQTDVKDVKKDAKTVIEKLPTRPAYSQAAAKPKPVTTPKPEAKNQTRLITRSKTVIEIRPSTSQKTLNRNEPRNRNQTNKCSYPFNLTTGRTSLFDAPNKTNLSKRPINRMPQSGSGDNKSALKLETRVRKRPPRPTSLKINEKGDKKENNIALENIKDCDEYGSSETIIPQRDVSRIESSESLKTLVPDDVGNSIEVLNVEKIKSDDDGWLTVKSRRLSRESKKQLKSHWSNRFHQPSATTSLPTLNMIESPKQEAKEIVSSKKFDRAKSEQPENMSPLKQCNLQNKIQTTKEEPKINDAPKPDIVVIKPFDNTQDVPKIKDSFKSDESTKSNEVLKSKDEAKGTKKDLAMIRQKSDVTGLKTRSSRTRALKKDKIKDTPKSNGSELTKNRLHSSLESLTTGLARSQESTREIFDFDKWKAEFKTTFKFLDDDDQMPNHNEILKTADPSEMSEIAEMTSLIEENERKISWALDFQSEVDQQKLCEEEDLLNRQIMELQQVSDIDLDTETDDTETDAEILCEDTSACINQSTENLASLTASLEDQYETALAGMSWAERVDTLGALEALVARDPGRAQQLHAKLSQGIKRRGSLQDALRRLQAKQARAERQRNEYQTERARKIHQLLAKVEEVKVAKNQLIEEKRLRMERRLQKAAENRDQHLKDIVRKAHDEEEKLREIAFIKQLEAENRRHEFLDQCRSHTTRLRLMRRDRLSKLEQKAAREAAVGARRQALEAARKLHVETLLEKRKERDARVEELKELKKQERDDAAREKAEGVKSRLSALAAAAELEAHALRSRIRHKQDASQQRLDKHLQAIREKATGPRQPTTSESQEKELEEEAARLEQERKDREKQKAIKKRARKIKQKLLSTGCEKILLDDSILDLNTPYSSRTIKVINQLKHLITPLLNSTEHESNRNGVEFDEPEKKKNNKKNKKIVNGDVEKKPESNNNNKEVEKNQEEMKSDNKKRKKKNNCNDKGDKPRLSKSGSVCSSLSDMSRGSGKGEKSRTVIDIQYLERQLNELHRIIDKSDKTAIDKSSVQKVHGVKVLGQFIAVAAEREDLASQITVRSVTTSVVIVSRSMATCAMSAAYFLSSNTCVHVVKLLSNQLDKDLQSDPKEMELAKQLGDCLSIALDSVLCSTRLYEESKDVAADEIEVLTTLRARAHTLISYLCLCGCITRAEKAGEARESIQTLVTVCADLCHPCDVDIGSERASATQSLRCALGTGVCGSRAEFCVLFAQGAGLEHSGGFVKAARTTHLLRALAELDHQIVQEAFGEGGWPLEFRAAVARLLSQHAPNDKEAPRSTALRLSNQRLDQTLSETMVLDLIVLVGFVVVNNPQLQETICDGWSVIKTLCTLPANWLVSRVHSHVLLPTLVVLSEHSAAAASIASELSTGMLEEYMKSPEAQKVKLVQVIKQGRTKKGKK